MRRTIERGATGKMPPILSHEARPGERMQRGKYVVPFSQLRMSDVDSVGGKNASLGEMLSQLSEAGINVPDGFATTAEAFRAFLDAGQLRGRIAKRLAALDVDDVRALTEAGCEIRGWIVSCPFPPNFEAKLNYISRAYAWIFKWNIIRCPLQRDGRGHAGRLVRRTAGDLPERVSDAVLHRIREVFASLYNDRRDRVPLHSKATRKARWRFGGGPAHGAQRSRAAGVMFTMDTESGFRDVVYYVELWPGRDRRPGRVNPDEFYVHKPMLAAGKFPIIRRSLGSKLIKMEFDPTAANGRTVRTVDVPEAERHSFSLTDADVRLALCGDDRAAL
jgi:pyruvate,water dikinase